MNRPINKEEYVENPRRQHNEPSSSYTSCLESHSEFNISTFGQKYNELDKNCILREKADTDLIDLNCRSKETKQQKVESKETPYAKDEKDTLRTHSSNEIVDEDSSFECHYYLTEEEDDDESIHIPFDDFLFDIDSIDF